MTTVVMLLSCSKFEDRPPIKWNSDYVDPTYIWDNRHTLAYGDTVMVCGWLTESGNNTEPDLELYDDSNSSWHGSYLDNRYVTRIILSRCPFRHDTLNITLPEERPCKVYVTGCFQYYDKRCDWDYCVCPLREEDIIFCYNK